MPLLSRLAHAWNAFINETTKDRFSDFGGSNFSTRPYRSTTFFGNEKSIVASIYTRLGIDVASIDMRHVKTDDTGRYQEDMKSGLNTCLTWEANIDQAATALKLDIVDTMFQHGVAAVVPVETDLNPDSTGGFDIKNMRVGRIVKWHPQHVRISLYNEAKGYQEEITLNKKFVAIVENPFYSVMNETNSTLQRLIRTLAKLDSTNEQMASGKLDIIIQLPYTIRSETRREQARMRREEMEYQLTGSKYGVAYSDASEKITQLNRPAENNLLKQVEYLTGLLYNQLGLTVEVMNGTADEAAMLNYRNRTIEPLVRAIAEAMRRAFLTKTARTQGQTILYFSDPFKLVTLRDLAEAIDVFSRNEIGAPNEFRQILGWKPSKEPKADKLQNSNMPQPDSAAPTTVNKTPSPSGPGQTRNRREDSQNGSS